MSADPRHFGNVLHRPDTGDADRRRGRGEGHAVVSSVARMAGRGLIRCLIVLDAPLGLMGGQAAARRGDVDRVRTGVLQTVR